MSDKINDLLTRGVANIIPNLSELNQALRSDRTLNIYLGIDPTATRIHLGNAVPLRKLQTFSDLGHNVKFLIGDFTALIGDTSDKDSERPVLTYEQIEANFQTYKSQASKLINFNKIEVVHNSDWLKKLNFEDVVKLTRHFSLNDFMSRELIKKRLTDGKSVSLPEVLYPVMQGYDSYFMDTDIQIGGTDQTFNMQAGRTLQKELRHKDSFVLSFEFLEGTDGRKMSKSWGNAIWLDDSPTDMFGKVMSIRDELVNRYFLLATNLPLNQIPTESHPMELKKQLAHQIVLELHSDTIADEAQSYFEHTVQQKEKPQERPVYHAPTVPTYIEAVVNSGLAKSNSEARRLFEQNGVKFEGQVVTEYQQHMTSAGTISVGPIRFVEVDW